MAPYFQLKKLVFFYLITGNESDDELIIELDSFESRNVSLSQTNATLDDLGLTPIKLHNLSSHGKGSYYREKLKK